MLRTWWLLALLLAALGLVMGGAHVLELPVRMQYEPRLYMEVTSTLYRYFGIVGGPIQVLAFLACAVLAWLVRGRSAFRTTLLGAICLGLSLALWFLLVQPVNAAWLHALQTGPGEAIRAYTELGTQWDYGHAAAFAAWLLGYVLLVRGVLVEALP